MNIDSFIKKIAGLSPHEDDLLKKGDGSIADKQFERAESCYRKAVSRFPDSFTALCRYALAPLNRQDYDTSLARFADLFRKHPDPAHEALVAGLVHELQLTTAKTAWQRHITDKKNLPDDIQFVDKDLFRGCIAIHVDTLPRSGTHFYLSSIMQAGRLDFALMGHRFPNALARRSSLARKFRASEVNFSFPSESGRYLLRSHFFQPLRTFSFHSLDCVTIRQFSSFLDAFYSWAHVLRPASQGNTPVKYKDYILTADSPEWPKLLTKMKQLIPWLEDIDPSDVVRYEDFLAPGEHPKLIQIGDVLAESPTTIFKRFAPDPRRLYFLTNDSFCRVAKERFEKNVLRAILDLFLPLFEHYYPEKMNDISHLDSMLPPGKSLRPAEETP